MGQDTDEEVPRAANLPPGFDEHDPYAKEDLSSYPEWWRKSVEEFRRHGMRPYRPPRFADGALVPPTVRNLEMDLDVDIAFRAVDPRIGDDWTIEVDGAVVATVSRERTGEGYTEYALTSDAFVRLIDEAASH